MKIEKMVLGMVCALAFTGVAVIADEGSAAAPAAAPAPEMAAPEMAPAPKADAPAACTMKMCDKCANMVKENDADKNGTLNAAEFETLWAACVKMQAEKAPEAKAGEEAKEMPKASDLFTKADTDANGELTTDEMVKACVADEHGCPDCKALNAECNEKGGCKECGMKMDGDKDDAKSEEAAPAPAAPEMK